MSGPAIKCELGLLHDMGEGGSPRFAAAPVEPALEDHVYRCCDHQVAGLCGTKTLTVPYQMVPEPSPGAFLIASALALLLILGSRKKRRNNSCATGSDRR